MNFYLGDEIYPAKRMMALIIRVLVTLLGALSIVAQSSTPTTQSPTSSLTAQASASVYPGSATYSYLGCYNETTGNPDVGNVRALAGGNMVRSSSSATTTNQLALYTMSVFLADLDGTADQNLLRQRPTQ